MPKGDLEDFDNLAHDYKAILDKSLQIGGESGEYFSQYKSAYLSRVIGQDFSGRILDYGCGIGLLSEVLARNFPKATIDGLDVSALSIEKVNGHLKRRGTFTADMDSLGPGYDLIVVANVLHHIERGRRQAVVQRLKKLLKKNGKIVIFEHNPVNPLTRKVVRESPIDRGVVLLPSRETVSYLETSGFQNVVINYIVFFPKALSALRFSEPLLTWLPLGAQYAVTGEYA